jgi:hypothetical protein
MDDRISDLACARRPRRNRRVGSTRVNADIIRFIPRPALGRGPTDFPTIAFRTAAQPDECADTAPCEYVASDNDDPA